MSIYASESGFSSTTSGKSSSIRKKVQHDGKNLKNTPTGASTNPRKQTKRGGRKFNRKHHLTIFSCNAAGLKGKLLSLRNEIKESNAAIFTVQETHYSEKGKISVEGFEIFESIRKKEKGGTAMGVHHSLDPILIKEYNDDFEMICVEIAIANKKIRVITGYGPQESWQESSRLPFFHALEEEVVKAINDGKEIIIEMDSNSKLGPDVIANDPHSQSENGKILWDIIYRNGLIVVNGMLEKCKGSITRRRETVNGVEQSIIDHVIVSHGLKEDIERLVIDESGNKDKYKSIKHQQSIRNDPIQMQKSWIIISLT